MSVLPSAEWLILCGSVCCFRTGRDRALGLLLLAYQKHLELGVCEGPRSHRGIVNAVKDK